LRLSCQQDMLSSMMPHQLKLDNKPLNCSNYQDSQAPGLQP
jgi:hypothetical protein